MRSVPTFLCLVITVLAWSLAHAAPTPMGSFICVMSGLAMLPIAAVHHWLNT